MSKQFWEESYAPDCRDCVMLERRIESLTAERDALQKQVDALQAKVHLCAGYDALVAENAALQNKCDHLEQQARQWAQEARTQRGTVQESYQAISGGKGEPGDWHGADPVKKLVAENAALREFQERAFQAHPNLDLDIELLAPPEEQK